MGEIVEQSTDVEASVAIVKDRDPELYEGRLELQITSPLDYTQLKTQLRELQRWLAINPNIEPVSVGGASGMEPLVIINIIKRIPILSMLEMMPPVESVAKQNGVVQLRLQTTEGA